MDRHHDQTPPDPARHDPPGPGFAEKSAERPAVSGDAQPTVWFTAPAQQPGCLSPQLARLILDDRTQVGDIVLDVDDDVAFAATALSAKVELDTP